MSLEAAIKRGVGSIELPRSLAPVVKAHELLLAHFERPDLDRAESYLRDFGLVRAERTKSELFMRGAGPRPYIYRVTRGPRARFLELGLSVSTAKDLDTLARAFGTHRPARTTVEVSGLPGEGLLVEIDAVAYIP